MTDPQDPDSVESPSNSAGESTDAVSDITPLDAETEALVTSALASLPPVAMPEDVHQRLMAALAAEPNPYAVGAAGAASATPTNVTSLPTRRERKSGWLMGVAGVAAASVLALVVGTTMLDNESSTNPPLAAAAIPMSASSNQYQKANFAAQVKAAIPEWRTKAASADATKDADEAIATSSGASDTAGVSSASGTSSTSATPTPSPSTSASSSAIERVSHRLREQVAACLAKVSNRMPMHVEIATYRTNPTTAPEQVAVAAVDGADKSVDVYAISVSCGTDDSQLVRDHVTLTTP